MSLELIIVAIIKNPQMLRRVPDHLKTKNV